MVFEKMASQFLFRKRALSFLQGNRHDLHRVYYMQYTYWLRAALRSDSVQSGGLLILVDDYVCVLIHSHLVSSRECV